MGTWSRKAHSGYLFRKTIEGVEKTMTDLEREVACRRTFAIISHPDAGKTTLTEKKLQMLLKTEKVQVQDIQIL